ncbi:MAG: Rne/Rng family ribonuclease [Actinomycetota bacterium]
MSDTIDEATAAETPAAEVATETTPAGSDAVSTDGAPRRRRRRGGRGRRGSGSSKKPATDGASEDSADTAVEAQGESTAEAAPADAPDNGSEVPANGAPKPARRRRGGRGRGRSKTTEASADADPEVGGADTETADAPSAEADAATTTDPEAAPKRRRSRGGRRRSTAAKKETGEAESDDSTAGDTTDAEEKPKPRRRRSTKTDADKPAAAPTKARAKAKPAAKEDAKPATRRRTREPVGTSGPTRLRRGRTGIRRRREPTPVIRQDEDMVMVLTENGDRDQIAVLEGRDLVQHYVTRQGARSMVGNVYLGRVQNVLPGMEAAFVDIGRGRNAVLYAGEVNYSDEDLEGPAPRIEQVLKSGQSILVQVTKDPMGGKGSRLTAQISLPGRYLVLVPNSQVSGISRRLPDDERRRLKAIVKKLKPESHGLIVRTAAYGASEEALAADVARLEEEWESIQQRSKKAKAPFLLYEEPELTVRVVRDLFTDGEFKEVVTDSPRIHERVHEYLADVAPDLLDKVHFRQGKLPVFEEYHVIEQIHKGLDRKVWLPSGGYLVIERTEAMTVIDVNTGKHVGKRNLEETVVKTNLEAASEVARQLRLRDIGGIIIIDFIDMLLEDNRQQVRDTLQEAMAQDKTRSQVFDIGPLGLLEVTRKRVSAGLLESFSEVCPTCEGRGILVTHDI